MDLLPRVFKGVIDPDRCAAILSFRYRALADRVADTFEHLLLQPVAAEIPVLRVFFQEKESLVQQEFLELGVISRDFRAHLFSLH